MEKELSVFEDYNIRRVYDEEAGAWYFSVVDVVRALIQQADYQVARNYWKVLKNRLGKEGSEVVTKCNRLKLVAEDGKLRDTDVATAETLLQLVQSVPSPKAEPIKLWLAKVGYERIQELGDPELGLERARDTWKKHGLTDEWIQRRMMGRGVRHRLTDYWKEHGVKPGDEYAILTNIIHQEWAGMSVKEHKALKGLETQNLRDHMSEAELVFTALAEMSTRHIAEGVQATGMEENAQAGRSGGAVAGHARVELEKKSGRRVVWGKNFLPRAR